MNNEELAKVKSALETGVDLAAAHAEHTHSAYAGYYPKRHEAVDRDVVDMLEALAIIERATPAAASAGAAGTIDERTFHELAMDYRGASITLAALKYRDLVAHIDQHTAEVVAEAVAEAREEERNRAIGIMAHRDAMLAERAGQAQATEGGEPVIGCPDPLHIFAEHCERDGYPSDDADTQAMLWKYFTHGMAWLGAATAPVSAEEVLREAFQLDSDDEVKFPNDTKVAVIWAERYYELRGIEEEAARRKESAPVSAAPTLIEEIKRITENAPAMPFWKTGIEPSAGAPVSAAEPAKDVCAEMRALCSACGGTGDVTSIDGEWRGSCDSQAAVQSDANSPHTRMDAQSKPVLDVPEGGQELPVSVEMLVEVIDNFKFTDPESGAQMFDELGFANEIGRRVLAMRQPDPAGEWVKRADLAMGQALGEVLPEPGADITPAMQAAARKYEHDCADYMIHTTPKGYWKALYGAAKQAGKESK